MRLRWDKTGQRTMPILNQATDLLDSHTLAKRSDKRYEAKPN